MNQVLIRLKQPSTWFGIANAVLILVTGGLTVAPAALSAMLVSLGLIVVNA